ncbi:hypothetical protein PSTT_09423 [Puccinia striiformis]|uniref:Cyclic nucleotide-binding domain-containing protein n=1 Tax=Puccinia striiformis TaxID=27350 RepID=A0A2S4V8K0_9BASI|nr:hypothetical protein PSTT_09423 [Puccinia striiformis]
MSQTNSSYLSLINELEREIIRNTPADLLQFCASWFQNKLEQERTQIRTQLSQLNSIYQQQPQAQAQQQQQISANYYPQQPVVQQQQQQQPQPVIYYSFNQPPPNNFPTNPTILAHQQPIFAAPQPPAQLTIITINRSRPAIPSIICTNLPNPNRSLPPPGPPVIEEGSEDGNSSSSSEDSSHVPLVPAGYNFGRREDGPIAPKKVVPKTHNQRQRIENSIKDNLLFRYLDQEQHDDVVNAMEELTVTQGTEVIVQGAVGDFFYVVEEGTFDVYIRGPRTYTYVPAPSNESQGTLSIENSSATTGRLVPTNAGLNPALTSSDLTIPRGVNNPTTNGTTVSHQAPSKKVNHYGPGGAFGELALMHNAPRAATVIATSPTATLWALDRITFRSILINHTARKRKMYENFLSEVPIFVSLSTNEISKIADSLEDRSFPEGVDVIKEGEVGREFYIIEAGRAEVYKKRINNNLNNLNGETHIVEEELVGILGKGDHFGELALLNSAPRAATIRVAKGSGRLRVAALGEKAFTRLLGPVIDILSRHAASHYGPEVTVSRSDIEPSSSTSLNNGNHESSSSSTTSHHHQAELNSPRSTSFSIPPPPSSSSSSSHTNSTLNNGTGAAGSPSVSRVINHNHNHNPVHNNPAVGFANWNGLNGRITPADDK